MSLTIGVDTLMEGTGVSIGLLFPLQDASNKAEAPIIPM
ncbi:hypothetical protein M095_3928 [Parabacteroides distasonis str. 3999B T(B) 4]|nr:hypothetical protein M095_3928 [Parabacteroides distasonis str. 3999B T(B) 4]